jgi:predicted HTH domain antitoxin
MNRIEAEQMVKRATALYCYVNHHVSIGYCAEIAGMSEEDFMIFLGEHKVSVFNYAEDEIQEDFDNA